MTGTGNLVILLSHKSQSTQYSVVGWCALATKSSQCHHSTLIVMHVDSCVVSSSYFEVFLRHSLQSACVPHMTGTGNSVIRSLQKSQTTESSGIGMVVVPLADVIEETLCLKSSLSHQYTFAGPSSVVICVDSCIA